MGLVGMVRWLSTSAGRMAQVLVGVVLLWLAFSSRGTFKSLALYLILGMPLLLGGLFDLNFVSAVAGGPLRGEEVRQREENPV